MGSPTTTEPEWTSRSGVPLATFRFGSSRRGTGMMGDVVDDDGRDRSVEAVAAVSLAAGLACALAPATTARLAGIDRNDGVVRAIGVADLALAVGLHLGRPSWPWMMARAATNPVIAGVAVVSGRAWRARLLAAGLAVATASDLRTAARLRNDGKPRHPAASRLSGSRGASSDQARSKRSRFMTLSQAATKSRTNFSFESSCA